MTSQTPGRAGALSTELWRTHGEQGHIHLSATLLEQHQGLQMLVLGLYRPCNNINVFPNAFSL